MWVPVRLSMRLPFSPRIEGALLPTGSIEQRNGPYVNETIYLKLGTGYP